MADAATTGALVEGQDRPVVAPPPYAPSWFDHFTAWVRRLPGPWWAFYLGLWGVLAAGLVVIKWYDGTYPVGGFALMHLELVADAVFPFAALQWLDDVARRAFHAFGPVLTADTTQEQQLAYRLTTLPAWPALGVTLVGAALGLIPASAAEQRSLRMATSPAAVVLETACLAALWAGSALFLYHTAHQLRVVNLIYTQHTRINLFHLGPLYALSRLTALTAVVPLPFFLVYFALLPEAAAPGGTLLSVTSWTTFVVVCLAAFLWPLWGAHQLLAQEKARLQSEAAARVEQVLDTLRRTVDSGAYSDGPDTGALKNLLDSLLTAEARLAKISTWPWSPEVPQLLITAFLLPVLLFLITQFLGRLLGP